MLARADLSRTRLSHETVTKCPYVLKLRDIIEDDRYVHLLDLCETDMFKAIWKAKVYWRNDALISGHRDIDGVSTCHGSRISTGTSSPKISCVRRTAPASRSVISDGPPTTVCQDGGCRTPAYMSPECWTSDESDYYSIPTDTWSLSLILLNMLTNHYPTPSDKDFEVFIHDEDHLFHTSLISEQLNILLK
ncbi:hypothetical protein OG21DRAFT_1496638 [Imleria badia]|nr:hypothetical protein OG21DRAFT_1496638 [Imleria badia]